MSMQRTEAHNTRLALERMSIVQKGEWIVKNAGHEFAEEIAKDLENYLPDLSPASTRVVKECLRLYQIAKKKLP